MFYLIPTKRGLGVELWGTYNDLRNIYNVISNFWDQERLTGKDVLWMSWNQMMTNRMKRLNGE